jgi:hypothetical protein
MNALWSLYLLIAAGLTGIYVCDEAFGWELPSSAYERIDPSVRTSPGSLGSSSLAHGGGAFWHSGFHGGK